MLGVLAELLLGEALGGSAWDADFDCDFVDLMLVDSVELALVVCVRVGDNVGDGDAEADRVPLND
jgi:hypothetical protein